MKLRSHRPGKRSSLQAGTTILETVIALGVLLVATVGVTTMATVAITATENSGHEAARAAEYAQDKMEQLIGLSFGDTTSDTTQFPSVSTGGTGLSVGGGSDPSNPVSSYTDYLDANGNPLTITGGVAPSSWFYVRVWQIQSVTATLKQITVSAMVRRSVGSNGAAPKATVTSLKSSPF